MSRLIINRDVKLINIVPNQLNYGIVDAVLNMTSIYIDMVMSSGGIKANSRLIAQHAIRNLLLVPVMPWLFHA